MSRVAPIAIAARAPRIAPRATRRANARTARRRPDYSDRLTGLTVAPTTGAAVINLAFAWQADGRLASTTDLVGNRTPAAATAALMKASLSTSANQVNGTTTLAGAAQRTLTYKTGGDLVQDVHAGAVTYGYIYNAAKRLTTVSQNGVTSGSYAYDYAGRRVWRRTYGTGAAQTAYVYDEDGHLIAEHNAVTGAATREYVWIGDAPIALADIAGSTTTIAYITTGQIDEPLAVTNAAKALIWNGYVDAFGNAQTFTTPATPLDMRLPGQSFQLETNNLSQNGWRDYDPSLGRYAEADPLGIDAGQNVYSYVGGDPLNGEDRFGLATIIYPFPPSSLPGGPYTPAGPGQRAGSFFGPKQASGPRAQCQYVPPNEQNGGRGYWKTKLPGEEWQRFNENGVPISPEEAHPGNPVMPLEERGPGGMPIQEMERLQIQLDDLIGPIIEE